MKVTALIPDDLIEDVKRLSGGKNITESLIIAIKHYVNSKRLDEVIQQVKEEPLQFREGFTAYGIRKLNRNR